MTLSRAVDGVALATVVADDRGTWQTAVSNPTIVPCRIREEVAGTSESDERVVEDVPTNCDQAPLHLTGLHVGRFTLFEGTKTCLRCHLEQALQIHASVYYQWWAEAFKAEGLSSSLAGKLGGINNFCIYPDIN